MKLKMSATAQSGRRREGEGVPVSVLKGQGGERGENHQGPEWHQMSRIVFHAERL
jgi:hypothetical protein